MLTTFAIVLGAVYETLAISIAALYQSRRGELTLAYGDEKLRLWATRLLSQARIRLQVEGLDRLKTQSPPFVIVSNHQSLYDIPLLFAALPLSLRMAAKKELFSTPLWGRAMREAGFVEIDRKNRQRAYEALEQAGLSLKERQVSLYVAPEGTRSRTGHLAPFKRGAFELARAGGLPVLPVAIVGAIEVHRSGSFLVHRGKDVAVRICKPLLASDFPNYEGLRDAARDTIEQALLADSAPA